MSQFENTPITSASPEPSKGVAGWVAIWIKAVSQPKEQTFIDIAESPDASARTAYIWAFIAGTVSGIIQAFVSAIRMAVGVGSQFSQIPELEKYLPQMSAGGSGAKAAIGSLVGGICFSPVTGLLTVLFFALFVAIVQWIAKLFGGTGTYDKLLYALAAVTVPVSIVTSLLALLSAIPIVGICVGVVSIGVGIYSIVLNVLAVKAVNRFGVGQAVGSYFIPGCTLILVCACIVGVGAAVFGAAIGSAFKGIGQGVRP